MTRSKLLLNGLSKSDFVADFETTTDADDCRVWLWGLAAVGHDTSRTDVEWGVSIDSFMQRVSTVKGKVYFHNLAFDGYFMLDWLLKHGYKWTEGYPRKGEFSTLISKNKKFYSMTVKWMNGVFTEFRDSLKKITMSVSAMADTFSLPESKGELDYELKRGTYHVPTVDELEYLYNDVVIVARSLAIQLSEGMTALTTGSDSLREFRTLFTGKRFSRVFPTLDLAVDNDIRTAYRGGWTYCDPRFQREIVGPGSVYDVNSLYPSVMYDRVLPFGFPEYFDGYPVVDDEFPLWIASITFTARLKPQHVPCIQIKRSSIFFDSEYVTEVREPETMSITNIDWEAWNQQYDIEVLAWNGGWRFQGHVGFFTEYIDKWSKIKNESKGGLRYLAKLHLNSLYGKFATNPSVTTKRPYLDDTGTVKLLNNGDEFRNPVYTAMGVFITSYARQVTINAAQSNYSVFAYADTDSVHLLTLNTPNNMRVADELGCWKHEHDFDYAMFWRAKVYMERIMNGERAGEYETHVAGMPHTVQRLLRFQDFESGRIFHGKLAPRHVPGGIVLVDGTFTLK